MRSVLFSPSVSLLAAACFFLSSSGETPRPVDLSLVRPCFRNLTVDARTKLEEFRAAAKGWRAHETHPQMFVRGQFFYGNERDHYLHSWYERPLHQDSSLQAANERGHMLNPLSWKRTVETAREMHLDGFAFFPGNPGCWDLLPRSVLPGCEIPLLAEFHSGDRTKGVDHCLQSLARIREMPNAVKLNGRIIVTCYPVMSWADKPALDFWPKLKAAADAKFGKDVFAFLPYARVFDGDDLDRPEMTGATLERTRTHLREILRKTDGLFYWMRETAWAPPELLRKAHREIVEPLVKSVLNEPEFRDKLLGVGYWQGHENCYRVFKDVDSHGLVRLKTALEEIDRMRPDFAVGFEWDEENENTHFRPTVSNGQTTQRLMRYFTDRMKGVAPSPYPGDAKDVPNLIVAYRKSLECGEIADVQVCNVPDGTANAEPFAVSFRWIDGAGQTVKAFSAQTLDAATCSLVSFACSATDLAESRVVRPELTVTGGGFATRVFTDGFWPLNVEANRNLDSKWVRQALREIPTDVVGSLSVSERGADGLYVVKGSVKGPKRFRSIEVLENADTVYMHDKTSPNGPDPERVRLSVSFFALPCFWREHSATGAIRVVGAPHAVLSEDHSPYISRKGMTWTIGTRLKHLNLINTCCVDLPQTDVPAAVIELDLACEGLKQRVRVEDLLRKDALSFGLDGGAQAVVRVDRKVRTIPPPPLVTSAGFTFAFKPLNPLSVLRLQLVDEDCRIWRGPAQTVLKPSGKKHRFHVHEALTDNAREVTLDTSRLVALRYDFSDTSLGDQWRSPRWRDLPMVGGGGVGLVNWLGCGDSHGYGHALGPVRPDLTSVSGHEVTVPRLVRAADGTAAIDFRGCAFASLPPEFLPRRAGYELRVRLKPRALKGVRGLFDSGNLGLQFTLVDGVPTAFICIANAMARAGKNDTAGVTVRGPALKAGEWNDVKLVFDQRTAQLEVNGVKGAPEPACGAQANPTAMAVGLAIRELKFFDGQFGSLELVPR